MNSTSTHLHARALLRWALATFALTALHHVYGAVRYDTPWRLHAVAIGAAAGTVQWVAYRGYLRSPRTWVGRLGLASTWLVGVVFAVILFGAFEGFYNHVAKNVLYFGGLPLDSFERLFPPPTYERPNDFVFELTGVAQVVPAAFAALAALRVLRALAGEHRSREAMA